MLKLSHDFDELTGDLITSHPPEDSALLTTTITFAARLHRGQVRPLFDAPGTRVPYIVHPVRVSLRLSIWGVKDLDLIVAALLHDVVEDCALAWAKAESYEVDEASARSLLMAEIRALYGVRVADLVAALTNPLSLESKELSLEAKHEVYQNKVRATVMASPDAFLIKLSDFIDNAGSLPSAITSATRPHRLHLKYKPLCPIFAEAFELHRSHLSPATASRVQEALTALTEDFRERRVA